MDNLAPLLARLSTSSPAEWCQLVFLSAAAAILALQVLPGEARSALMDYGARRPQEQGPTAKKANDGNDKAASGKSAAGGKGFFASLTSYGQVPHSWFWHFYALSASLSAFWAWQFVLRGSVMRALVERQHDAGLPSMDLGRAFVAWSMMAAQGSRRLYESLYVVKPGSSPMWFPHWALGLVFYMVMSVSIWIEGAGAILESWESFQPAHLLTSRVPSAVAFFIAISLQQNECHSHLASLPKYTLPIEGWFQRLVCPHYTCECLIYLTIAFVAAPPGRAFNQSVLCGLLFVAVNLGATAHGTKQWYAAKFGQDKVAGKKRMVPYVF